jgi:hypothetical protein
MNTKENEDKKKQMKNDRIERQEKEYTLERQSERKQE